VTEDKGGVGRSFQWHRFDREALKQHQVTPPDVENAERYVARLQGTDSPTYRDIAAGCYYATSALLHEVVEVRILLARDRRLLRRSRRQIRWFLRNNEDAHVQGLIAEYTYLQQMIEKHLGAKVGIGALIQANTTNLDYDRLLEARFPAPLLEPTDDDILRAERLLDHLKELDREVSCANPV